jgi:hypothetical protein
MDDAEYLFHSTSREQKALARSARAKKNGSRSKYCSLPSDNLTARERKELNGKVETINTMRKLSYEEWKFLSLSLKKLYIEALFTQHHARLKDIAEMWQRDSHNIGASLKAYGIELETLAKKSKGYKKRQPTQEWLAFLETAELTKDLPITMYTEEPASAPAASESVKQPLPDETEAEAPKAPLQLLNLRTTLYGKPELIFGKVLMMLDPSASYRISITVTEEEEMIAE